MITRCCWRWSMHMQIPAVSIRVVGVSQQRAVGLHRALLHAPTTRATPLLQRVATLRHLSQCPPRAAAATEAPPAPVQDEPGPPVHQFVLDVQGMKCGGCSAAVKRILQQQDYIATAGVNLVTNTAAVGVSEGPNAQALANEAAQLLTSKGFPSTVRVPGADPPPPPAALAEDSALMLGFAWTLVAMCCLHHAGHALHDLGFHAVAHLPLLHAMGNPWVGGTLGGVALLGPGRPLLLDGAAALVRGAPNMNSLIGLGTATSFAVGLASLVVPGLVWDPSFLEEPVMLLAFVLLGRTLEARARSRASADLRSLASLVPDRTRLVLLSDAGAAPDDPSAELALVPTTTIRAGDVVRVLPGERFPVDGTVIAGRCGVDESMLTGESMLVAKREGDAACAGTVCYEGAVTVAATNTGSASRLGGIAALVEEAQSREAPVQRLADRIAGVFCYSIMAASASTFAFWVGPGASLFPAAVHAAGAASAGLLAARLAVDVLVVACPCALGLATPTAVVVASSAAARRGLLLRGGDVLEALARVDTVVLDKTGTLTRGKPVLQRCISMHADVSDGEVLALAAAVEATTRHPLADALVAAAGGQVVPAVGGGTVPGCGAWGVVDGRTVAVGKAEWVAARVGAGDVPQWVSSSETTAVYVGVEGRSVVGVCELVDEVRAESAEVVEALRARGCEVLVLSGDAPATTRAVAAAVGVEEARGGMSPEDKVARVRGLRAEGRVVAMVGDGVNDAPALAGADVGVALSSGLEAAASAADVVLVGSNLRQLVTAMDVGRASLAKIRQNLMWALLYNLGGVPLAAGVLLPGYGVALSPSVAAGLMACSSIAVVTNSLLLRGTIERLAARGEATAQ